MKAKQQRQQRPVNPLAVAVDVQEAASRLGLGINTVYGKLQSGELRGLRVGTRWLVPVSALTEYVEGRSS